MTDSVTTTCPITTTPRITVTKNCPLLPTPRGGLYTYSGSVSNAGNVSLVNVYVMDDQPTNNTPVIGPITLAPGATVNFTNSYVAPVCCCLIIDTLTAARPGPLFRQQCDRHRHGGLSLAHPPEPRRGAQLPGEPDPDGEPISNSAAMSPIRATWS